MDKLQQTASNYSTILNKQYYFEIARKQKMLCFTLSFERADFYHLAGLHKLTDIAALQGEPNKSKVFDNILNGSVSYDLIKRSRFYSKMNTRLELLSNLENMLDSNQIVFKYMDAKNQFSRIEADCLLENAFNMNIVFLFLTDRNKNQTLNVPVMCCRSFFPMEKYDYARSQPIYTLLKKVKIDTSLGDRVIQYDRSVIIAKAKSAVSESERKSIMQQLNEKKAQSAINNVLAEKRRKL